MYRSHLNKEDQPIVLQHPISEFEDEETPYLVPPTFLERVTRLPLVRTAFSRGQQIYENTKERSPMLNTAFGYGENIVQFSLNKAAEILGKTGISDKMETPLKVADVVGCHFLDRAESKMPIITKSPYEIKLMMDRRVEDKVDQFQTVKEAAADRVKDYKRRSSQMVDNVKQIGTDKVQDFLKETSVGQSVNSGIEYALSTVDQVVEKYLPESHYHYQNGNASNGHVKSNGFHTSTSNGNIGHMEHAKQLSYKVTRRVSLKVRATSHNVVDAVIATPAVSAVHSTVVFARKTSLKIVGKPLETVKNMAVFATAKAYVTMVDGIGKLADLSQWAMMTFLPSFISQPLNLMLDRSVNFVVKSGFHVPPPVEIPDELVEN